MDEKNFTEVYKFRLPENLTDFSHMVLFFLFKRLYSVMPHKNMKIILLSPVKPSSTTTNLSYMYMDTKFEIRTINRQILS